MTEEEYPRDQLTRWVYRQIEKRLVRRGSLLLFTADSTRQMYLNRYRDLSPAKCVVLPNGYDEEDFSDLDCSLASTPESKATDRPVRLVHAGVVYTDDRDPRSFFRALGRLKAEGTIDASNLRVDLMASGSEDYYSRLLREFGIENIVYLLPPLPHQDALKNITSADGLLLFQAASCSHQIPAKVYEYFRTGKPILALTNASGDTAALLREVGGATIVELDNEDSICRALPDFVKLVKEHTHPLPDPQKVRRYTRRRVTTELARYLDQLALRSNSHKTVTSYEELSRTDH
jgi:glycosyltransferase involved in cell wall biosynthesis